MLVNVNYEDVKTKFTDLIEAALRGDKVVITKNGQQIVELVAIKPARKPRFGSAKGKIKISDDFDAPLDDFKDYMP
jgi:prevent-host-death family protein